MSRWLLLCLLSVPLLSSGCSMCCGPYDYEYPMLNGGNYVRSDPEFGRVGSLYSDSNGGMHLANALTNKDVPQEPKSLDDDEDGADDPNFDGDDLDDPLDGDVDPDADLLDDPDAPTTDVDTSARVPRRRYYNRSWR